MGNDYDPTLGFILSNFAAAAVLAILFYLIHLAPTMNLINTGSSLRLGGVFIVEIGIILLVAGTQAISAEGTIDAFLKALVLGLFLGLTYSFSLIASLGYILPGLMRWLRTLWLVFPILWVYQHSDIIFQYLNYGIWNYLPFLMFNSLIFIVFLVWVIMDDGIELLLGYVVGHAIFSNSIISTSDTTSSWGTALFQVQKIGSGLEFMQLSIVRFATIAICTLVLFKVMKWQNWRKRLFGRYENPTFTEQWVDKIDEIGGSSSE